MAVMDTQVRSMTCDNEGCDKTVTFNMKDAEAVVKENPWLNNGRFVQTGDRRGFFYCSDVCEINAVGKGTHNIPEPKKIVDVPGVNAAQAIKIAAQAAEEAKAGTKALKAGKATQLKIVK
jgi:hypothetical protein